MRKIGSYCPDFCPPAGHTSQLWCHFCTYIKDFQPILLADPHKFSCRQKGCGREFRTVLLRLSRPLRKRLTALLYIFRLCSQLRGSSLVWQLLLVTSSNASMPTFSRHHLHVSSTPQHILHSTPTQSRTHHFPLSAYTEQTCSIMTSSCP